jgi:hypothetical protein
VEEREEENVALANRGGAPRSWAVDAPSEDADAAGNASGGVEALGSDRARGLDAPGAGVKSDWTWRAEAG